MPTRSRKEQKAYDAYRQQLKSKPADYCTFCDPQTIDQQRIDETGYVWIVQNKFRYSHWDSQPVTEHLMLIPKKHVATLTDLPSEDLHHIMLQIADYESRGYNIYARASHSATKSIVHQHTHLLKTEGPPIKRMVFNQKPYIRLYV